MTERYGNFAEGMGMSEVNDKVDELNARIDQLQQDIATLQEALEAGHMTHEAYEMAHEPLDQQLSIAKYNRDAYLARLESWVSE
jgi:outer membrane murein-binding lipoprotein Lpp